ncbi:uncharacterized protein [Panulirus ornatus]|uniref:uncharacterized protein n=1 Tax=Panulirus ornatus TaxID=150431 RepID=UPI003A83B9B5
MKKTLSPIRDEGNGASSSSDGTGIGIDPKSSVQTVKENLNNVVELQRVHKERLQIVDEEITKLQKFRKDYEHLLNILRTLPDKTSYEVMVPFGSLAFMPGRLLHTNEILVLLGDNWFAERSAKQAAEIVQRRLKGVVPFVMPMLYFIRYSIIVKLFIFLLIITEEHRKKVARHYVQLREQKQQTSDDGEAEPPPGTSAASEDSCMLVSQDKFAQNLTEKERQTYEDIMKRLDQLDLEEAEDATESEDDGEGDEGADKVEVLEEGEMKSNAQTGAELRTKSSEGVVEESSHIKLLSKRAKLKRRVSWADDLRPLVTVIPDDDSDDIYRIKYSSGPLSLPLEGAEGLTYEEGKSIMDISDVSVETVQSPSDIYKVFGHGASGPDPQPRGILKKSSSLPSQDDGSAVQDGWCYLPQPLDIEVESPEELPPPPPSPPPKRTQSLKPAFSYRVLEHKIGEAQAHDSSSSTKTDTEPKKVSKFKAARSKKQAY